MRPNKTIPTIYEALKADNFAKVKFMVKIDGFVKSAAGKARKI